jgi:hypothetical protein
VSDEVLFHEEQQFRGPWVWLLLAIVSVPLVVILIAGRFDPALLVGVFVPVLVMGLFLAAKLVVEVDRTEIRIAFHFLWPTRRIALANVKRARATRYNSLLDYGGWGVRLGWKGWAFNTGGDEGVLVETNDGKRVMIGSRRAHELEAAIARAISERAGR